jgi:hypothetical protein
MAYSTIKQKKCKCGKCNRFPTLGCSGYYYSCMPDELKEKVGAKRDLQIKKSNAAKSAATRLRMDDYKKNTDLEQWFKARAMEVEPHRFCWECGIYVPQRYVRDASAHILFKSIFPSISTHPLNFLFLCAGNGCHNKSHTIEQFQKMRCFPMAIERFYLFEKEIKEKHKYLDLFKDAIKNYKQ